MGQFWPRCGGWRRIGATRAPGARWGPFPGGMGRGWAIGPGAGERGHDGAPGASRLGPATPDAMGGRDRDGPRSCRRYHTRAGSNLVRKSGEER